MKLLKKKVSKKNVLALLEFRKVFQMDFDSIGTMIVTTLTQEGNPIVFFSYNLNGNKKCLVYDQ